ncbi:hypothetical protein K378_03984 [Streptomyces sp. Amel2xB2]|uniref:hypothetical protein n=1 Tax=Streptomyces sp. Amel2xB2 TaxID=1305829 RepID=UPI000DBF472E|nr:hypothetical protein [Streptomyces sp. Amel2xB2]RAJ61624.1 hypothetical protein K378_03984 [Streptomyces sp. Amel2xB2]
MNTPTGDQNGEEGAYGAYFGRLAALLRHSGMPEDRVTTLTSELRAYAEEAGGDVTQEFGPAERLAEQLCAREAAGPSAGSGDPQGESWPGEAAEQWVWTADAFQDRPLLERFGGEGWEVERLDALGRFVCRRDLEHPMRWEYRRETAGFAERAARTAELAPEGWEPCGVWGPLAYFKRPAAALDGPAARIAAPPPPPRKRTWIGPWIYVWIAVSLLAATAAIVWGVSAADFSESGTVPGLLVGAAAGGAAAWLALRSVLRRGAPGGE